MRRSLARLLSSLVLAATITPPARSQAVAPAFVAGSAEIEGSRIHYRKGGSGPAVVLLHGYAQTSRMWNGIMPELAKRFTVIVPDLPSIGDSDIPANGLDMTTAARRIHALTRSLGVDKARVVGHDIGLMVAYAYAAQFPADVEKLVEMDAFLPGVGDWADTYNSPSFWHFRFHGAYPERLVRGREADYFSYYWNVLAADSTRSLSPADRRAYVAAYSRPGRMRAGWEYFDAFLQTAKDFARFSKTRLTMPVLVIGGERSGGKSLGEQVKLVASDVRVVVIPNTGHWLIDERPKETAAALLGFL